MFDEGLNIKGYLKALFYCLVFWVFVFVFSFFSKKELRVVFCDVGQGDAVYLRIKNIDILIDGGPDRRILNCLGRYMPFYDRKIDFLILSHPEKDHFGGFNYVVDRYQTGMFIAGVSSSKSAYKNFLKKLKEKRINQKKAKRGDEIILEKDLVFKFFWPPEDSNFYFLDTNDLSLVFLVSYKNFDILFTGDASVNSFSFLKKDFLSARKKKVEILKIPHHGSKNSLNQDFLSLIDPLICIISVGKNSYGHPAAETLRIIKKSGKKYLRTDENGYILIDVDKKGWRIKWEKNKKT